MNGILDTLATTSRGVVLAVGPLAVLFLLFQVFFLQLPRREVGRILTGTVLASAGLFLFLVGVRVGLLPVGHAVGVALGKLPDGWLLAACGFVLGFVTTWGEPAVRILTDQVEDASSGSIRRSVVLWAICLGVALAVGLGLYRIARGIPLSYLVVPGYGLGMLIMTMSERSFVSIAIDAGGVATGPLANTFLLALALGTATGMGYADALEHGLGLVALIALAPVLSVMILGLLVRWKERGRDT